MCCTKFILFTSNAIIFVLGATVVGISSVVISRSTAYGELFFEGVVSLPVAILIVGLIVCIIGFLGCFGALKESKCMLYTYSGIMLVLFIAGITIAILVLSKPEAAKNILDQSLDNQFANYGGDDDALTSSIDKMQQELECCGVEGPSDWEKKDWIWSQAHAPQEVPASCCDNSKGKHCSDSSPKLYHVGCSQAFIDSLQDIQLVLGIVGIVLAIFLFFSMSTACGIAKKQG